MTLNKEPHGVTTLRSPMRKQEQQTLQFSEPVE